MLEVIGETEYPSFVLGENEASSSKSIHETPHLLLPPTLPLEIQLATVSPSSNKSGQSKPTSGYMKPVC